MQSRIHPSFSIRPLSPRLLPAALVLAAGGTVHAQDVVYGYVGATSNDSYGRSVSSAGDVNGDGYDDVIVGAPRDSQNGVYQSGTARVYSGWNGALLHEFSGSLPHDGYGWAVSGAGDVNDDGFDDVIIGAEQNSFAGGNYVHVWSGATGGILWGFSGSAASEYGYAVGSAGDVDSDGHDDVMIGSPASGSGSVQVRSGATGMVLYTLTGIVDGDRFGHSLSGGIDATGDGTPDIIVGAPQHNLNWAGYARVYDGATGAPLWFVSGNAIADLFGSSVCLEQDVDGDGHVDFVVGAPKANTSNGVDTGKVFVYSGFTGAVIRTHEGASLNDFFGVSVGMADVNSDGHADIVVGVPGDDTAFLEGGSARVYSGLSGGLYFSFYGEGPAHALGQSVSGAGRVNAPWPGNDAREEVVIGAPRVGEIFSPGRAYVVRDDGTVGTSFCSSTPNSVGLYGQIQLSGNDVVSENDLSLWAWDCPPSMPGIFFMGPQQTQVLFGEGYLCATGGNIRLTAPIFTNAAGRASYALGLTQFPAAGNIVAGSQWNFQFWYRDPAGGPSGFNLTRAVQATFQ